MKVHVAFGVHNFENNLTYIRLIAQSIRDNDGTVLVESYEAVNKRLASNQVTKSDIDWRGIIRNHTNILNDADLFIIEGSNYTFSNGFWSSLALMKRKPTLFLYRLKKNQSLNLDTMFVSGLTSDQFIAKTYRNATELRKVVSSFIESNKVAKKVLNLELNEEIYDILERRARKARRQKSEIIKDILDHELRGGNL